jgi:hypothetical protein
VAPENVYLVAPGEQRGGPFIGGRKVKVKAGDLLSIPPNTWHLAYGDPGVSLQYTIIHILTLTTLPLATLSYAGGSDDDNAWRLRLLVDRDRVHHPCGRGFAG